MLQYLSLIFSLYERKENELCICANLHCTVCIWRSQGLGKTSCKLQQFASASMWLELHKPFLAICWYKQPEFCESEFNYLYKARYQPLWATCELSSCHFDMYAYIWTEIKYKPLWHSSTVQNPLGLNPQQTTHLLFIFWSTALLMWWLD